MEIFFYSNISRVEQTRNVRKEYRCFFGGTIIESIPKLCFGGSVCCCWLPRCRNAGGFAKGPCIIRSSLVVASCVLDGDCCFWHITRVYCSCCFVKSALLASAGFFDGCYGFGVLATSIKGTRNILADLWLRV